MAGININIPDEIQAMLNKRQQERGFSTPTEYIRQLIRDDCEHAAIEQLLIEGMNSGEAGPLDADAWASIRKEARERNLHRDSA